MLLHGAQYGFYNLNGDCNSCKFKCKNDSNCAGVECGRDSKCVWWKQGECGTLALQSRDDPSYKTCMKYDEGKVENFNNILFFSYKTLVIFPLLCILMSRENAYLSSPP